jgi:tRNA threonylcarbamoyladenosine biosynthesis protein TsaE
MTDSADAVFKAVDEARLAALAAALAPALSAGGVVHLHGSLGAGKTTFARALLRALGVGERVKSPTYTLIESYALPDLAVHHLDLYRIAAAEELEWLGLRDLASGRALWLIEWPERGAGAIPAADLIVDLAHAGAVRDVILQPLTASARQWLSAAAFSRQ